MGSKSGGTQGYRYYMSLLMGLCRGPIDELVEIEIGDQTAWTGHKCSTTPDYINEPNLFGGEDKEGGIQGPFNLFMGGRNQVLPGPVNVDPPISGAGGIISAILGRHVTRRLPGVKESIGGRVPDLRGVATLWFDGMVSAMSPYLKEWAVRVRRSQRGWQDDNTWYKNKATIYLGGGLAVLGTNKPTELKVGEGGKITFTRNLAEGDTITINGRTITVVADQDDSDLGSYEFDPDNDGLARTTRKLAGFINARSGAFKAGATFDATSVTIKNVGGLNSIYAMNAAHIIYECFTNKAWGRGLDPAEEIDDSSFTATANRLCDEGFGVCLAWYRKEEIDVFIKRVVDLVGAVTYTDRETGKINMKLIRDDYEIDELPLFTPETGLLSIDRDDSASADDAYSEIIGTSVDPVTNLKFQRRVHNLAAYQSQQAPSSLDQDYTGIPTKDLLDRVLLRDLRAMSSGLKRYNLTLDRRAWRLYPGSVIRVSHPGRGIANVVLRINEVDDGNLVSGAIQVKATVDVFALPATSYQGESDNSWIAPSRKAAPAADERLVEVGYRDVYRRFGQSEAEALPEGVAYIGQLALAPNTTSLTYDLLTRAEGESFANRASGDFTGKAALVGPLLPLDTEAELRNLQMFDGDNVGQALLIGDELVELVAFDEDTNIATLKRGVADTVPAAHDAGTVVWTYDDDLASDSVEYAAGETAFSKVLTRTSIEVLPEAAADEQEVELVGRPALPYPPGDVQLDGESIYAIVGEHPEPVLTWVPRNRITQADRLVGFVDGPVEAEAGTTYEVKVIDTRTNTVLRTADVDALTWTYDATLQAEDGSPSRVRFEIRAKRDDLLSYQAPQGSVALYAGWGYGWGNSWGG